jgi:hypothetical protein
MDIRKSIVLSGMFLCIVSLSICGEAESVYKFTQIQDFWGNNYGWAIPQYLQGKIGVPPNNPVKSSGAAMGAAITPGPFATTTWDLLAKASPDECYDGIGNPYPSGPPCASGQPKVNQAYVWGLVKNGRNLWFGTIANTHCLVMGTFLGSSVPHDNASWVCEFGSRNSIPAGLPGILGDFRPPKIYAYDTATETLINKTPLILAASLTDASRLNTTIGVRSAGAIGDLVILGGQSLQGGINLFAFNGSTGAFVGSTNLAAFNEIRKWLVVNGVLYTTVGKSGSGGGGSVLRWTGTLASPFTYDIVGDLDARGAELALHEGRLFVATWPNASGVLAGLFMSPTIPAGGLTTGDAGSWTKVWKADDYEPDPTVAGTYAGGALHSFDGHLYWGTLHVPFLATKAAVDNLDLDADGNGTLDPDELVTTALGTYRPTNIFRGRNFATTPEIEVLYGLQYLPVYDPSAKSYTIAFDSTHQNKMPDPVPKWGLPGFGNFFNAYTWSMAELNGRLFIGTFDWSYLLAEEFLHIVLGPMLPSQEAQILADLFNLLDQVRFPWYVWGADLYRINNKDGPALPEDVAGVGNFTNYGIRNMIHGSGLYLGMANPMNLLTDPNGPLPLGGWELIALDEPQNVNVPTMNEWGMIILVVLIGLGSVYYLRRQRRTES